MFTDWTLTDPHYFYTRGMILGVVLASYFWAFILPWIKSKLNNKRGNK